MPAIDGESVTHEAGHCVVALSLGVPVIQVEAFAGGGGETLYLPPTDPVTHAAVLLGGAMAAECHEHSRGMSRTDRAGLAKLRLLPSEETRARELARSILRANWSALIALSRALWAAREMGEDEVNRAVAGLLVRFNVRG